MTKILNVYLNNALAGQYRQDQHGKKSFKYDAQYLINASSIPLSYSLPLQETIFDDRVCHSFFGGLLPEDTQRRLIARIYGVSEANDFSMLEKIGGECAGAISFFPHDMNPPSTQRDYLELSPQTLQDRLNELPTHPLLIGCDDMRLSLAGVQDKVTIAMQADKVFLPLRGTPSTHILKPEIGYSLSTVINEAFCLKLAKIIGLNVVDCQVGVAVTDPYLLVKRYDRVGDHLNIQRLHQEDFCQALGIDSKNKYQNEGGPSLAQCFNLIRAISSNGAHDLASLLDTVIFNYIVGNCDAHGKNFSIIYKSKHEVQFAPMYDVLSTIAYPKLSTKMAMKIGGEYDINKIRLEHFTKLAEKCGLNVMITIRRVIELSSLILEKIAQVEQLGFDSNQVRSIITQRARRLIDEAKFTKF